MEFEHDLEADAIYISLSKKPYDYGIDLDNERRIDYSADKTPIGIELLCASRGINITDLPNVLEITDLLQSKGFQTFLLGQIPAPVEAATISLIYTGSTDSTVKVHRRDEFSPTYNVDLPVESHAVVTH